MTNSTKCPSCFTELWPNTWCNQCQAFLPEIEYWLEPEDYERDYRDYINQEIKSLNAN